MLKDIEILSDLQNSKAEIRSTQEDYEVFVKTRALVMIRAITNAGSWKIKVVFFHEKKKFRIDLEKAEEAAIILP